MKKLLLILLLLPFGLASCSNSKSAEAAETTEKSAKEVATDSVQAHLKRTMNDPASYQPVSVKDFKVLTERDSLQWLVDFMDRETKSDSYKTIYGVDHEKRMLDLKKSGYSTKAEIREQEAKLKAAQDSVSAHLAKMERYKAFIAKMKPVLADSTKNTKVIGYSITHDFRGKNKFGGMILTTFDFVLDKNFNITRAEQRED